MRTANPTLSETAFQRLRQPQPAGAPGGYAPFDPSAAGGGGWGPAPAGVTGVSDRFTSEGAIAKTALLLALVVATAIATMVLLPPEALLVAIVPAALIGLVVGIATALKPQWARVTAPLYAIAEGVVIGGLTLVFNQQYPGIATQAALGTFAVLAVMLVLYRTGLIKVTQRFRMGVVAATGAIFLVYLANFVAGFFGASFGFLTGSGWLSIGISVVVIAVAALNLVLDFDFIATADREGLPKQAEWYAAFGLIVTLIWLYLEILRLLAKLQRR